MDSAPIELAAVTVTDYRLVIGLDTVALAYTDSEGRYSDAFTVYPDCDNLSVYVEKHGYYPKGAGLPCVDGSYTRDFRLVPAELTFEVRGTVTDAVESTPIELATIYVTRSRRYIGIDTVALTYTNSEGFYSDIFTVYHACEGPPRLILDVKVEKLGYHSSHENMQCAEGVHTHDFQLVRW